MIRPLKVHPLQNLPRAWKWAGQTAVVHDKGAIVPVVVVKTARLLDLRTFAAVLGTERRRADARVAAVTQRSLNLDAVQAEEARRLGEGGRE